MGHTPGPWYPIKNVVGSWDVNISNWEYGQSIASCIQYVDTGSEEANARLIAAAPDMLAALEKTLDVMMRKPDLLPITVCEMQIRAAIKQAKGEI